MKYINIIDISEFECYSNVNARLLYLELCARMDVKTRDLIVSQRRLERSLPMTYAAIRHALSLLIRDGLVAQREAQDGAQDGTQRATQRATHLHIMSFSELSDINSATDNAQSNATSNARNNADFKQEIEILNNKNLEITHTRASEVLERLKDKDAALYIDVAEHRIKGFKSEFCARMAVKTRTWKDETDLISHFLDWANKNKKSIINKLQSSDQIEAVAVHQREEVEEPHPRSIPLAEWKWIIKTVQSGSAAPGVIEAYEKGCAELKKLNRK